jgi:putative redox protein
MPRVVARGRGGGYTHEVEVDDEHSLVVDEPEDSGGANEGPSPTRVLAAALAACTAITVEMYAARKEWDVGAVEVEVDMSYDERGVPNDFTVSLRVADGLDSEQLERLRVIAGKCPVHRALASETHVTITDRIESLGSTQAA